MNDKKTKINKLARVQIDGVNFYFTSKCDEIISLTAVVTKIKMRQTVFTLSKLF